MKLKKYKGFSLAEVMIALLVVSLALAAAVPTITKRSVGSDGSWSFAQVNEDAPAGIKALYTNSSNVIIGHSRMLNKNSAAYDEFQYIGEIFFAPIKDQLVIFKRDDGAGHNFVTSHLAFYNTNDGVNPFSYAGRLAMDENNIALGLGTLQNLNGGVGNTAIGQYALLSNNTGNNNTAVGFRALQKNTSGSNNTAIGSGTLLGVETGSDNIAVGASALAQSVGSASNNIAFGYNALNSTSTANNNIAIGSNAGNGNLYIDDSDKWFSPHNNKFVLGYGDSALRPPVVGFLADGEETIDGVAHTYYKGLTLYTDDFSLKNTDNDDYKTIFKVRSGISGANEGRADIIAQCGADTPFCIAPFKIRSFMHLAKTSDSEPYIFEADGDQVGCGYDDDGHSNCTCNYLYNASKGGYEYNCTQNRIANSLLGDSMEMHSYKTGFVSELPAYDLYFPGFYVGDENYNKIMKDGNISTAADVANYVSKGRTITVKAAVDYIEAFKETADVFYRVKDSFRNGALCLVFGYGCNDFKSNSGSLSWQEKFHNFFQNLTVRDDDDESSWEKIKAFLFPDKEDGGGFFKNLFKSDIRLKNILGDSKAGLKEINQLKVKNYTYKDDVSNTPHVGVIAQDLKKVFPNSVFKGEDGYYRIDQEEMFFAMVNAVKELSTSNDALTASSVNAIDVPLSELEAQNKKLQEEYKQLRKKNVDFDKRLSKLERK